MATVYTFRISSFLSSLAASAIAFSIVLIYVIILVLLLPGIPMTDYPRWVYFIAGGLWTVVFVVSIKRAGALMEFQLSETGLICFAIRKSKLAYAHAFQISWSVMKSYSITKTFKETVLRIHLKEPENVKEMNIPTYNNDPQKVTQFVREFQHLAAAVNLKYLPASFYIDKRKPFNETRIARLIGYIVMAYVVFISIMKLNSLEGGRVPWTNIFSTWFFAGMYLYFVFYYREKRR